MSASANPDNDVAVPCANNCGFWGTAATNNFCSSCYKEKIGDLKNKNNSSSSSSPVTEKNENNKFESESKSEAEVESKTSAVATPASNSNTLLTKRTQADASTDATETKIVAQEQEKAQPKALAVEDLSIKDNASSPAVVSEKLDEKKPVERRVQKNRQRCFECKKRVGLTGNECRCGYIFCGTHRYPEEHKCDFDFHGFAKTNLSKKATASGAMADKIQGERL